MLENFNALLRNTYRRLGNLNCIIMGKMYSLYSQLPSVSLAGDLNDITGVRGREKTVSSITHTPTADLAYFLVHLLFIKL